MQLPGEGQAVTRDSFQFRVDRPKLAAAELQDGYYRVKPFENVTLGLSVETFEM
jgi:hypothetical protein